MQESGFVAEEVSDADIERAVSSAERTRDAGSKKTFPKKH
jgi:hypothetical protein